MSTIGSKNILKYILIISLIIACIPFMGILFDVVLNMGRYVGSFARTIGEGQICHF